MSSGRADSGPTAQVLSLRRRAEVEAQAAMRQARSQLEQARLRLEQLRLRLLDCEQALLTARAGARQLHTHMGSLPAADLQRQAEALRGRAEAVRQGQAAVLQCESEAAACLHKLEARRADWLQCIARREAAELHETLERRDQRRMRAQRERSHEDEARDRFAIARSR